MTAGMVPPTEEISRKKKMRTRKKKRKSEDEAKSDDENEKGAREKEQADEQTVGQPEKPVHEFKPGQRARDVTDWFDITEICEDALGAMTIGEMLEAPDFQLMQAMSAIEMMDPKMDSGFEVPLTAEEAAKSLSVDPSDREQAHIMDEFLCQYVLWLDGHSLAQTILSCVYLHCWDMLDRIPPLRTFCGVLIEMIRVARDLVLDANFYDDEDFSPHHFNFNLTPSYFPAVLGGEQTAVRIKFVQHYLAFLLDQKNAWQPLLPLLAEIGADSDGFAPNACFNAKITRALLVPGPPRDMPQITREMGVAKWKTHLECLHFVETHYLPIGINFSLADALRHQVELFSYEPDVLARSCAFLAFTKPDSSIDHIEQAIMDCLINDWMLPSSASQHMDDLILFITHAAQIFLDWLRIRHATPARQHRKAIHLLYELNVLQNEAGYYDNRLKVVFGDNLVNVKSLRSYAIDQALQVLLEHLMVGFQLELYDDIELCMIYWFMDYLYGLRVYTHNEALCLMEQQAEKKQAEKTNKKRMAKHAPLRHPKNASAQVLTFAAEKELCRGIFRLHIAFKSQAAIKVTKQMEESMPMRYNLRFRQLERFQLPHRLTFEEFMRSCAISSDIEDTIKVLNAASASFREVKALAERVEKEKGVDMGAMKRVGVANSLVISQMIKRLEAGKKTRATFSHTYHPVFVSTKLVDC
eukprot:GEMP01033566.1.p1 GENE.GEMP01033566.1~~GEMP01033566.1.p1  ORF type:complete len:703 (+),score=146.80 GEMP01033566.1:23-2110(+)